MDLDLFCWYCERTFGRDDILRDAYLIPRDVRDGGPYRVYRCRGCDRVIHVERNAGGAYWARPPAPVPVVDDLVALFDRGLAAELERKRSWERRFPGKGQWFHSEYVELLRSGGAAARESAPAGAPPPPPPREAGPAPSDPPPRDPPPRDPPPRDPPPPRRPAPAPEPPEVDPYEVLGLEPGATREEFFKAFREQAKKYHPDRFAQLDDDFQRLAHEKFIALKQAFDAVVGDQKADESTPS